MKRFSLLFSAVVLFLFVGCDNKEPQNNIPIKIVFSLDKQEVAIAPDGGSVDVVVCSNYEWTIEGSSDWCTPSVTSGDANEEGQKVSFSAELTYDSREATFLFCCADQQISLIVGQKLKEVVVANGDNTFDIPAEGGIATIAYQTSVSCEVVIPDEAKGWISVADTRGLISESCNLDVAANTTYDARSAVVKVVMVGNESLVAEYTINQAQNDAVVVDGNNTFALPVAGGEVTLGYQANVECEVVIPEEAQEWISTVSATRALTAASVALQVAENTTYYQRSAVVKVVMADNHNVVAEYTITQEGQECYIEYTSISGSVVEPYWTTDEEGNSIFGANIVSNSYENGVGRIYFDAPISSIGYFAFAYISHLKTITIPSCVTTIGDYAFSACEGLQSVTIPEGVTTIGNCAFEWCSYLKNITIPESVTTLGDGVFAACSNLEKINGKFATADGRAVIVDGVFKGLASKKLTTYTIPEEVTIIGAYSCYGCQSLQSITIPEGVTTIGNGAFINCMVLKNITLPSRLTTIGNDAFLSCLAIKSITIPDSVSSIGDGAFSLCSELAEIKGKFATDDNRALIIDGVLNCVAPKQLTTYKVPENVTTIGKAAFIGCSDLQSVTIPNTVTLIDNEAFTSCGALKTLTLPDDGVTTIGYMAFADCASLKTVTLPNSITLIDECAFMSCPSLTKVYCKATTPPTLGYDVFYENADNRNIYVPTDSVEAYKVAELWSDYADRIRDYEF